jgi:hypothetical protein
MTQTDTPRRSPPAERTPDRQRRGVAWCAAAALLATSAWCFAMFLARRPALDYFCVLGFAPLILAALWLVVGWQMLALVPRSPVSHRLRLAAAATLSLLLAPYVFVRAGSDMFTLSVRYHLVRAGGADKVRAAFNHWVAGRPAYDRANGRKLLYAEVAPDGSAVPLPEAAYPAVIRYIHERFPCRWGTTRDEVAVLDNVSVLTTTDIMIGPPGWEPEGGLTTWHRIIGSRRKLADGVWVQFGAYAK